MTAEGISGDGFAKPGLKIAGKNKKGGWLHGEKPRKNKKDRL